MTGITPALVDSLLREGRLVEAAAQLQLLLQARPGDAAGWLLAARVEAARGQPSAALEAAQRAVELAPLEAAGWSQLGALEQLFGRLDRAERALQRGLQLQPDARSMVRLAAVLRQIGRLDEALTLLQQATTLRPGLIQAWQQLAELELERGQPAAAVSALRRALPLAPERAMLHALLGQALSELGQWEEACDACAEAVARDPQLHAARVGLIRQSLRLARWSGLQSQIELLLRAVQAGVPGIPPELVDLLVDDPMLHLRAAQTASESLLRSLRRDFPDGLPRPPRPPRARPRVALLWLGEAAQAHTRRLLPMLQALPAERPALLLYVDEVVARQLGGQQPAGCEAWFVIATPDRTKPDPNTPDHDALAHQLIEQEVDILVDAGGFAAGAAPAVAALRPAPLQMAWLGYGGSSGAPWMDYLIGDPVLLPDELRAASSERWIRLAQGQLPGERSVAPTQLRSRGSLGLPAQGMVYVNLGGRGKIGPALWAGWMEILREVPDSVLCMDTHPALAAADQRLRAAAQAAGVDPERLRLLTLGGDEDRQQLLRQADLYLDSWPAGARSSGSAALWAGLPVLTLRGRSHAARIASSQLQALGLDELIADSQTRYLDLAILIGSSADLRAELRGKLAARRATSPLFDPHRFARDFCDVLQMAWQQHLRGLPPQDLLLRAGVAAP